MSTKAVTFDGVTHGFLRWGEGGYIDKSHIRYSDYDKILETCRTDPTIQEYTYCEKMFPILMTKYLDKGFVDDATFEALEFPADKEETGK